MTSSAYIHIPFCKKKCNYCGFVSFCNLSMQDMYIENLLKDIEVNYKKELLKTIYFGGGTPSILKPEHISKIVNKFNIDKNSEITLELNPDDCNENYLGKLKEYGVNRISLGAQTFDDQILEILGRRHSSKQTIAAIANAKKVGFENISIDLMYGLPMQTFSKLEKDLNTAISLDIQHISTYGLKIEKDTPFERSLPQNLPNDDMQAEFYIKINEFLKKHDFYRYEISNFAKNGYESRHNLNYWKNGEYYGFGVSAHGYKNGLRYSKLCTIEKYIENPIGHEHKHSLTVEECIEEEIFLGFRKSEGINVDNFYSKFNIDFELKYAEVLKKYMPKYIQKTPQGYCLTLEGILLSNIILAEFLN